MSSLRVLARKGRVRAVTTEEGAQSIPAELAMSYVRRIYDHDTVAINAQNVAESLIARGDNLPKFNELEDVTPPFRWTWVEAYIPGDHGGGVRLGCLTQRMDAATSPFTKQFADDARALGNLQSEGPYRHTLLMMSFLEEGGDCAGPLGMAGVVTDEYGQPQGWAMCPFDWPGGNQSLSLSLISHCSGLAMEAFVWINTQGSELVPDTPKARVPHGHREVVPMSVWHRIVIGPTRVSTATQYGLEAQDRREHWVRAHRADYRHGNGLFGRIKALIWVPDHRRGNKDLGTIVPEYVIGDK